MFCQHRYNIIKTLKKKCNLCRFNGINRRDLTCPDKPELHIFNVTLSTKLTFVQNYILSPISSQLNSHFFRITCFTDIIDHTHISLDFHVFTNIISTKLVYFFRITCFHLYHLNQTTHFFRITVHAFNDISLFVKRIEMYV